MSVNNQEYSSWTLPSFDESSTSIIASEEKLAQDRAAAQVGEDESIDEFEQEVEPLTAQQLEEIRLQAHKEGYQAGYEEGQKHGLEAGVQEGRAQGEKDIRAELEPSLNGKIKQFSQLVEQLEQSHLEQQDQLKPLILNMVTGLTRQFIEKEFQSSPSLLIDFIKKAVASLPGKPQELSIKLNPNSVGAVKSALLLDDCQLSFSSDDSLGNWDCIVRSEHSRVVVDFESRWQALLEQFASGDMAGSEEEIQSQMHTAQIQVQQELNQDLDQAMDAVAQDDVLLSPAPENTN
ncbi:flagellar assembly protein FliH [uncultured Pseudoteredinibacter sp.]|uniref:flagellar assembly protein FliH n=1 Tax=uncultured Pseudoteredinibacter sp. TaxID=1641701 RepID=UPI0026353474|nr:flagellar assembly protein FliH [uncultured Pseudoteredinibacter sp.]